MAESDKGKMQTGRESRRILIADDDPAILRLVATILERDGFAVVTARDGREAYKILQDNPTFTAAILDVVMPHISGPELVRQMKTEQPLMSIPVMMMTAEQDPKLSQDSLLPVQSFFCQSHSRLLNFKLCCKCFSASAHQQARTLHRHDSSR